MTMTTNHRNLAAPFFAAVLCLVVLATGCTGGDEKAEGKEPSTTTTALSDCVVKDTAPEDAPEGAEQATTTSIVQQCLDEAFTAAVTEKGSSAVKDLKADQLLGFGHGLCAYAQSLAAAPEQAPSYQELLESTAASWKVKPAVVEEMLGFAAALCPDQLAPILALRQEGGGIKLTLEATGAGKLAIAYLDPDGNEVTDSVDSPWTSSVRIDDPIDFRLSVTADGGEATCSIKANGHQVTTVTGITGVAAVCSASADDIRSAAG